MMVNGGDNEGSRRLGESKVYARKSFKGSKNSKNCDGDRLGIVSENNLRINSGKISVMGGNGEEKALLKQENRVTINLSMTKKEEVRELRRKLENELNMVRSLVRKIEGQKNGNAGGLKRDHSDMLSGPFNPLSVPMSENQTAGDTIEKERRTPKANKLYKSSEFFLGKEKFQTGESNRKSKGTGKKGGAIEEDDHIEFSNFSKQAFKSCIALLERLMKHKHGWVFNTPVDPVALGLHDYSNIVKHPMDLGTVKSRLTDNYYKSPTEFAEDVQRTFHNALTYNPEGHDVYVMAKQLLKVFEEKWAVIESDYLRELKAADYGDGLPPPTSRKTARPPPPPPDMARTFDMSISMVQSADPKSKVTNFANPSRAANSKKPKAKEQNKRDMTFEEKQKLSASLQDLPSEKLENVVQIIKKKNPSLCQHDEEIEVDIDSFDTETLWELDRFVTNYKKSSNKNKRKAEPAKQAISATEQNVSEKNLAPMVMGTLNQKETEEEKFISSTPAKVVKQDDVAGRSSSASSSSTNSGSSSGSDSESS